MLIPGQQKVRPPDSYEITASHAACPLPVHRCIGLMQKPVKYSINKTAQTSKAIFTQNRPNIKSNTQMQTTSFLRSSIPAKYSHKPQKHTHVLTTLLIQKPLQYLHKKHPNLISNIHTKLSEDPQFGSCLFFLLAKFNNYHIIGQPAQYSTICVETWLPSISQFELAHHQIYQSITFHMLINRFFGMLLLLNSIIILSLNACLIY